MVLLTKIHNPTALKKLKITDLPSLCEEIRDFLLNTVSKAGGHLASNLGAVELTVALHYVFDSPKDKLCWDVGHQTYVHKILTGRGKLLGNIRKTNGMSGFPKIDESDHDHYNTGHAGTSVSQALGEAVARDIKYKMKKLKKKYNVVAVTGDASIVSGMAFESLNHAGDIKHPFIVILNDNEMSISKNVGALNYTFNNIISRLTNIDRHKKVSSFLEKVFLSNSMIHNLYFRFRKSVKGFITENHFFEALGFRYLGPIDGHDVIKLVNLMRNIKNPDMPTLLHLVTKKGKGYEPAEEDPVGYHGVTPFETKTGIKKSMVENWGFSGFVGAALSKLADSDPYICAITPAMKEGSGLVKFAEKHPKRFFDTGIAEQHATTFAGALAKTGMKPFLCIYSTFLQRGYDQLIQDIALMNFPVRLVLDRAGCVGGDGETHQGLYDIAFMSCIPNIKILSAKDPMELMQMLTFMSQYEESPISVRFPKKSFSHSYFQKWSETCSYPKDWSPFQIETLARGKDVVLFTEGVMADMALKAGEILAEKMIELEVVSLKSIRPFDRKGIQRVLSRKTIVCTLENHVSQGGVGDSIQKTFRAQLQDKIFQAFAYPEEPIPHGSISDIESQYGLDPKTIAQRIYKLYQSRMIQTRKSA